METVRHVVRGFCKEPDEGSDIGESHPDNKEPIILLMIFHLLEPKIKWSNKYLERKMGFYIGKWSGALSIPWFWVGLRLQLVLILKHVIFFFLWKRRQRWPIYWDGDKNGGLLIVISRTKTPLISYHPWLTFDLICQPHHGTVLDRS